MSETKPLKRKKVLIFSLAYEPLIGGAEVAVRQITDHLTEIDFDLLTVCFDDKLPRTEKIGRCQVYRLGFSVKQNPNLNQESFWFKINKYLFPFNAYVKAFLLHREKSYSATWAIMANYAGFAALFFKWFNPKTPFILTLQEGDKFEYIKRRVGIFWPLYKAIFRQADFVQAISNYLADYALKIGFKGKPIIIPNGVEIASFLKEFPKNELFALRQKLVADTDDVIITTSRLVVKNGVADLIFALSYLPFKTKLLILGTGNQLENLKRTAEDLGVKDRVIFLGSVPNSEVPKYLKIADVFVRPSLSEGLGNSFIEAMASGLPIVGTPVGGIVDFLKDDETGLFCEVENPQDIAAKIKTLLVSRDLWQRLARNGREVALKNYDWTNLVERFRSEIFDKIV